MLKDWELNRSMATIQSIEPRISSCYHRISLEIPATSFPCVIRSQKKE